MHSIVTIKNVSWPHFSWPTLYVTLFASCDISSERMLDLIDHLDGQFGAERDDEFSALLIAVVTDDVQPGQCLDVGERHVS